MDIYILILFTVIFVMLKSNETVVREDDGSVEICLMSNEPFPKEFTIPLTLSSCEGDPCLGNGAATGIYGTML